MKVKEEAAKALARGLKTYQSQFPCRHGHTERYAKSSNCVTCLRERWAINAAENAERARNYYREYRKNKPEQVRQAVRRWQMAHPDNLKRNYRSWYRRLHPESKIRVHDCRPLIRDLKREAKAKGYRNFTTGYPCDFGHNAARRTSSGHCLVCERGYRSKAGTTVNHHHQADDAIQPSYQKSQSSSDSQAFLESLA